MEKYQVTSQFIGYVRKTDQTNLPPGHLVAGSRNVLFNQGDRIQLRNGYTLDGQTNAALFPIVSSYDWLNRKGDSRHLRAYDDELEYRYVATDDTVTWRRLADAFTSVSFNFGELWDTTEKFDRLLMVNGTSNIFDWSGGITTFASATAATITKQGAGTWASENFYTTGTRSVVIDGITYTYTGGETTTTITGVTPDPTLGGHAVGAVIHQSLRTTPNSAITGLPATFSNDLISTLYNQIYIGSFESREVYVSKQNSLTDFSFGTPRAPGEGALFVLDAYPNALIPQEDKMYITAGRDQWYLTAFQLSGDITKESLTIQRLKTNAGQAARSQSAVTKIKNDVAFLTFEPTFDTLGRLGLIDNPQSTNISDPIKVDFDSYDFTGATSFYFRDNIYIAVPTEGLVLVYNLRKQFWEAPQVLPIQRFAEIDGLLYGHSSQVPETYQLFADGVFNDNGNPIDAVARFSYQNFADRANGKNHDELYVEGYIQANTDITATTFYNFGGSTGSIEAVIEGDDDDILFAPTEDWSLGVNPLGVEPLGGGGGDELELPPKFRVILTNTRVDYYEVQFQFSSNNIDFRWELLAYGPNAAPSTAGNNEIKI